MTQLDQTSLASNKRSTQKSCIFLLPFRSFLEQNKETEIAEINKIASLLFTTHFRTSYKLCYLFLATINIFEACRKILSPFKQSAYNIFLSEFKFHGNYIYLALDDRHTNTKTTKRSILSYYKRSYWT